MVINKTDESSRGWPDDWVDRIEAAAFKRVTITNTMQIYSYNLLAGL